MLYAKIVLTIKQDETVSDSKMLLFRGDKNVDVEFTLKSRDYVLSESAYAQLILTRPYASTIFSDLFEINQNKVSIRITDDMIEKYDFYFDDCKYYYLVHGLDNYVNYIGHRYDSVNFLSQLDVFVYHTDNEPISLPIIQAMIIRTVFLLRTSKY